MRRILTAVLMCSAAVSAQAQTIIMRKPIADAVFGSGAGGYGGPKPAGPATPAPVQVTGTWTTSPALSLAPACSDAAAASRDVWCRGADGARLADSSCATEGPKPSALVTIEDYTGCGYAWQPVGGREWSSTCSDSATATRRYVCQRQDGAAVAASNCDASHRETETETASNLTACQYEISSWQIQSYSSACSARTDRTWVATGCLRTGGGEAPRQVAVAECAAARIPTTRTDTIERYDGCGYDPTYSATYGACVNGSQSAPITSCRRTDGVEVSLDQCGTSRQTTSKTCTVPNACGTLSSSINLDRYTKYYGLTETPSTRAGAQSACERARTTYGPGICQWNSGNGSMYYVTGASTAPNPYPGSAEHTVCS